MKSKVQSFSFLMELIIVILFFAASTTVCASFIVQAKNKQVQGTNLQNALFDTAAPQLTAVCRDGGDTLLTVVDQDTGIDWSTLSVSSSVGQLYRPVSVDDGTGTARFALPPGRYTLQVGDKAGNAASGPLQVLG